MKRYLLLATAIASLCLGDEKIQQPWLTGPLIAPSGEAVPFPQIEIEPFFYIMANIGAYDKNWHAVPLEFQRTTFLSQTYLYFGLTSWLDMGLYPQFSYAAVDNRSAWRFGDLPFSIDIQLLDPSATPYFPGIKFAIGETFPTGSFDNLNPALGGADATGLGSFGTSFNVVFYKLYHLKGHHWLSTIASLSYTVNSPTRVHGFHSYGGGHGTNGVIVGRNIFQAVFSFELTLSQNWVFAFDNVYTHRESSQFFGTLGVTPRGDVALSGLPSGEQISFAPAIEYNFSENLGIIAGCWFTAWGRNIPQFINGVMNVTYLINP
jgi:hypothetical protein